jgi:hypothetical protein
MAVSSRLYPSWGSGDKPLDLLLTAFSFECVGKFLNASFGDKIVLPASALRTATHSKLPFPLYLQVSARVAASCLCAGPRCVALGSLTLEASFLAAFQGQGRV